MRWALDYKGITYKPVHVSLIDGESESPQHKSRNPFGFVPALESRGEYLNESLAIIEWLEEINPSPTLYPGDPWQRAQIRSLAEMINAGTQPLTNLSTLEAVSNDVEKRKAWFAEFCVRGLNAFEKAITSTAGKFCYGDHLSVADLCLIPQCYSALRYDVKLEQFPRIKKIYETCLLEVPSCKSSHPDKFKPD